MWQRLQNKLEPRYISILMKRFFILHQDNSHLVYFLISLQNWLMFGAHWCMWLLNYISPHIQVHVLVNTHTHTHKHTPTGTLANAHTKLPALITYIKDHLLFVCWVWLWFLMVADSPLTRFWPEAVWRKIWCAFSSVCLKWRAICKHWCCLAPCTLFNKAQGHAVCQLNNCYVHLCVRNF